MLGQCIVVGVAAIRHTQVRATLNGKDLVVTPAINDIYKYLTRAVKNVVESAKMFTRWMHGTCRPAPPQVCVQ
jgi:dynein heavy chain, axonemal